MKHYPEGVTGLPIVVWSHGWMFDGSPTEEPQFVRVMPTSSLLREFNVRVEVL